MRIFRKKRFFLLAVIVFLGILFFNSEQLGRWMYPINYVHPIKANAEEFELEAPLIAAIIRVETNFKVGRESPKGALGLMQLMPTTAEWIIEQARFEHFSLDKVRNQADINIKLGSWYLKSLYQKFSNNRIAVIAAYNAGPGNVSRWIEEEVWDGRYVTVSHIPFPETRHYVQRVVYYYNKYKSHYPEL